MWEDVGGQENFTVSAWFELTTLGLLVQEHNYTHTHTHTALGKLSQSPGTGKVNFSCHYTRREAKPSLTTTVVLLYSVYQGRCLLKPS